MIAGQRPTRTWKNNPNDETRTIEEAVLIAKQHGVVIPDEVVFFVDECEELHADFLARGPEVSKLPRERVYWSDLVHNRTKKIPFRIWSGILSSDEAIVAVFAHEMHELITLRPFLKAGGLLVEDMILHTEPGRLRNLHDEAWDVADQKVDHMRGIVQP